MKHVNINASQTEQVTSEMLDTLALLCGMSLDETSDLVGSLISEFGFHDTKAKLMARFPHLALQIDTLWVRFADDEVRKVLGKNVKGDENANLTAEELAAVTDIGTWFKGNTKITSFTELGLTGVTRLWSSFDGCKNLKEVDFTRIARIEGSALNYCSSLKRLYFPALTFVGNYSCMNTSFEIIIMPLIEKFNTYSALFGKKMTITPCIKEFTNLSNDHPVKAWEFRDITTFDIGGWNNVKGIIRRMDGLQRFKIDDNAKKFGTMCYIYNANLVKEAFPDYAALVFEIGGAEWQAYMKQLAEEEGKTFDDYSLRYIDYDIYGVDYATDELNALTLSIPDEYLGRDGETFVFDTAPLAIGYDPEPTRKEYFTLSKSGSDGVSVADTEVRFIKMLTVDATNAGSLHDVTFTAVSTQVEGVKAVRTFKCAYPLISAVNLSFGNQFVSAALESNTDNTRYTQLEFSSDGGIGVSDNGWVYANAHGEAATGSVTVRSKTTPSSVSSIEVAVTADAVQRQFFADAEVERVILSKKVDNKGNVISEDVFRELKDISEWFKGNTAITSFNELCNIKSVKIREAFMDCSALETVCFDGMTIVGEMNDAFRRCKALKSVDFSKAKISKPGINSMYCMFYDCYALERVNFRGMEATTIDNLCDTFTWCVGLKYVDLGDLDTSNFGPKYALDRIFKECRKIESLKLGAPFFNFYKRVNASTTVFKDLDSWVNDDEIAAVLSCLPDLTSLNLTRILYFSANTFAHITQTQIEEALAKGWTITK